MPGFAALADCVTLGKLPNSYVLPKEGIMMPPASLRSERDNAWKTLSMMPGRNNS